MKRVNSILLVEDDLSLIYGLDFSLKKNGFDVDIARTVQEAYAIFENHSHDLLILDLTLPDGSGYEICKRVRQSSAVPIIFLTASDEEVSIVKGLDMGADDYITKPFKLNELISRINALLRRAKLSDGAQAELSFNGITVRLAESRQGVGIGLTLSKTIIEKHGGSIAVESWLGKGTAFRLMFPKLSNL
jgi:DNA-binding response OmpR family regulator